MPSFRLYNVASPVAQSHTRLSPNAASLPTTIGNIGGGGVFAGLVAYVAEHVNEECEFGLGCPSPIWPACRSFRESRRCRDGRSRTSAEHDTVLSDGLARGVLHSGKYGRGQMAVGMEESYKSTRLKYSCASGCIFLPTGDVLISTSGLLALVPLSLGCVAGRGAGTRRCIAWATRGCGLLPRRPLPALARGPKACRPGRRARGYQTRATRSTGVVSAFESKPVAGPKEAAAAAAAAGVPGRR